MQGSELLWLADKCIGITDMILNKKWRKIWQNILLKMVKM